MGQRYMYVCVCMCVCVCVYVIWSCDVWGRCMSMLEGRECACGQMRKH